MAIILRTIITINNFFCDNKHSKVKFTILTNMDRVWDTPSITDPSAQKEFNSGLPIDFSIRCK